MNVTIIKEFWLASWEVRLIMIAGAIEASTGGMVAPYLTWIPGTIIEGYIVEYWHLIVLGLVFVLRKFKTSSQLVFFKKDATDKTIVAEVKAASKPETELSLLKARLAKLEGTESPKA